VKNQPGPTFRSFALFILLAGVLPGEAMETEATKEGSMETELRAIWQGDIDGSPELAGLQVLVMRDGELAYEYAGGYARLADGATERLNLEHKPRIASISKLVAAIGLMRLVEDGRVDLDTDVSDYLGFALRNPAFPGQPITLRMVLSHTSSIRDGDYYIGLYKRIRLARRHKADLFVSIHADAFKDKNVRGSSVYTLSQKGASSKAAKWLADKENSADQIGGIDLDDKDPDLYKTIWDMVQNATMEHSRLAAKTVLKELRQAGPVHNRKVQQARFAVLKAPDIPSMLVETAFISNPDEETRLRSRKYQNKMATAILAGIKGYFKRYPPPGTRFARSVDPRRHVINSGDTLSEIAKQYRVSLSSLRSANRLSDDMIRVGQVLKIPES